MFARLFRWVFSRKPVVINISVGSESDAGQALIRAMEAYKRATERPVN